MSFEKYGLSPEILSGLADVRIEKPTPLQEKMLPIVLDGKHALVETHSNDDLAFLIPALQKITEHGEENGTQVLILTPSIERAEKIDEQVWALGYHAQISSALMAMKGDKAAQEKALNEGAPVIVANPGRFIEILDKNNFRLNNLKLIVIDEAHEMQQFNLVNRVKDILRFVDCEPQIVMLSQEQNSATKQLVKLALKNPELIGFDGETIPESKSESSSNDEAEVADIDIEEVEEKLEKASIKVVLKKDIVDQEADSDSESESQPENAQESEIDLNGVEEKLEEADVSVVLKSDLEDDQEEDASETVSETEEVVDLEKVEEKLEEAEVSVVLKKDLDEDSETETTAKTADENATEEPAPIPKHLEQAYINVPPRMKISTLMAHLEESKAKRVVVFAASSRTTDRLFRIIRKKSWGVVSLGDDLDEATYNERFERFHKYNMRVLLVGGLSATKIDMNEVGEVINYDVPSEMDEYRYRAELVGNGKAAQIISLVSKMDREDIARISKEAGYPPEEIPLPEELVEKKKSPKKNKPNNKSTKNNNRRSGGRSGNNNRQQSKDRRKKPAPKKQGKGPSLPRPTYDGLSGGRNGETSESKEKGGVFGWVKKLFN
ncbi:MAG: DEAD/DEAH box helicase [Balneolaceae bacterium]|nr:DEAD/DEAH box helicase [Balneolaceae bacterium]